MDESYTVFKEIFYSIEYPQYLKESYLSINHLYVYLYKDFIYMYKNKMFHF